MFALVTGSSGFLGSHLVERLRATGHRVRGLIRDPRKGDLLTKQGAEVAIGDLNSAESLVKAVEGVDVVFHAAAMVESWGRWSDYLATTVQGTKDLLKAAVEAKVQRFAHISTIRVYDDRYCRRQRYAKEDTPSGKRGYRPFGSYAHAKALAELAVWEAQSQLPVTILRPAWIYGPRDETILPPLVEFMRTPRACWPSRHDPCADPIYVTDVADCAIAAAQHPAAIGQAYNVAPSSRISAREFLLPLFRALGIKPPEKSLPYFVTASAARISEWAGALRGKKPAFDRTGLAILTEDVRHDPAKALRDFGWSSQVDLTEGIEKTAAWFKERYGERASG